MANEQDLEKIRLKDAEIAKLIAEISAMTEGMDAVSLSQLRSGSCFDPETRKVIEESIARQKAMSAHRMKKDVRPLDIAIIGGAGKMGAWFGGFLSFCGHRITVIDPASGNGKGIEDCRDSDAVIVSVPIHATAQILRELDSVCREDALIFDLTSLKGPVIDTLKDMAARRKVCSVHPM
ncbi:MAG: prephenate dehydrogenase/arogenate dehydrogenase family protein, partial [Candidatus Methanomethylophilaceae archaeon]|nr:prephenate dehydrogenase/arogenate dehydrogenase family protein [Candidatus Methanomethylophilaceae archaeon]